MKPVSALYSVLDFHYIKLPNMESNSNEAEKIMNAEFIKYATFNHCNLTVNVNIGNCSTPVSTFLGRYEELRTLNRLFAQHQLEGLDKILLFRKYVLLNKLTMKTDLKELAGMLGYQPLALQVATSYVYKRYKHNSDLRTVLADYMKQPTEGTDRLLKYPVTEYDNLSVYASMLLTLEQLENMTDNVSKFVLLLINVAVYMDPRYNM